MRKKFVLNKISEELLDFGLVRKSVARQIIEHYNGDAGHETDIKTANLGYGFIHYSFIRNLQPENVLCVGSRKGFIPAMCTLACKDNQKGKVDFVDAGYDDDNLAAWSGVGFWNKNNAVDHFSFLDLTDYLDFFLLTSEEYAQKFPHKRFEYIYIDGDHSYEGVKLDYNLFWPRLKKGGLMVFHDVTVKNWGKLKGFGVWKFWEELKNENKIIFPLNQSGLGILQKISK